MLARSEIIPISDRKTEFVRVVSNIVFTGLFNYREGRFFCDFRKSILLKVIHLSK